MSRRTALKNLGVGAALATTAGVVRAPAADEKPRERKGRIKQSVCQWCFKGMSVDALCEAAAGMGLKSVELLGPKDFPSLKKHGLICALVSNPSAKVGDVSVGGITKAWNRVEYHDALVAAYETRLKETAEAGYPTLICFSGNRDGMSDKEGLENCVTGLKRIVPTAEKLGVTLVMELLNSRVNHKDYMCDHTEWGVELVKRIGSDRFKLLYDIYHMQIMEGDVIATIRQHHPHIAHYHTAGVPGRNELDENQELFYPAIMRAIVETGYQGYVSQEFVPRSKDNAEALAALRAAVEICDV
ncbi:MAG TPA: TIM barrel protein [Lacunisphaera sp.]|nr:TIM barrel protein [Lacunisphaera sp.]